MCSSDLTSTLTYTMTVTNDDSVAHELNRIETQALLWFPTYVPGSTSGFTTADPSLDTTSARIASDVAKLMRTCPTP